MKTIGLFTLIILLIYTIVYQRKQYNQLSKTFILELAKKRHSGKNFDPQRQVSFTALQHLFQAAQLAPSSYNEQPWKFIIGDKITNLTAYMRILNTLSEKNKQWAKDAPILIVITASQKTAQGKDNIWAAYDTGAAALSMSLEATALGLMTHQIGGFNREDITSLLKLPKDTIPVSIMALGYEDQNKSQPILKKRNPLAANFFKDEYGSPFGNN